MTAARRNKKCIFLSYLRIVVRKKDMVIKPVKNVFFTGWNLILLLCLWIKQHTDGQLCILHPDECRYLWACPRTKNDLFPVFSNAAGCSRWGHGHWHAHRLYVRCIFSCILRNSLESGDGNGGHCYSLCRRYAHSFRKNIFLMGAGIYASAFQRTAVFVCIFYGVIAYMH